MAERKQVNKYYPPDWDPRKGSANKRVGQHPLRDRAKKLSQGILVIRFELPYNIWCGGCGNHVGMGVRYNAEKSKVGNYYSTPIYKFRMKCHLCDNKFEIQTDPKNHDYVILSGARRKEQRWDPHENEQIVPEDKATQKKMATDPMYKLEHGTDDKTKATEKTASLAQLEESRISMVDDYILNRMARDKFRAEKQVIKEAADADKALLERASLDINLLEETDEDKKLAGLLRYSATSSFEDKQKEKRKNIELRPLFKQSDFCSETMKLTEETLPHHRHAAPTLSRRGEIKQKLGWALKSTAKNAFDSSKVLLKKDSDSIRSLECPRSILGIRLKSPSCVTDTESVSESRSLIKNLKSSSLTSSVDKKNKCDNNTELECLSSTNFLYKKETDAQHQIVTDPTLNSESKDSNSSKNQLENNSVDQANTYILLGTSDLEIKHENDNRISVEDDVNPGNNIQNTSGLKTLISSYECSDSDSDKDSS